MFKLLLWCWAIQAVAAAYQGQYKKGPFILSLEETKVDTPSKTRATVERATIVEDAEITIMDRSYWKSYCYQGTAIDPNTGCLNDLVSAPPTYQEATEWIKRNKCQIGRDCVDCYGDASEICIRPMENARMWVDSHQLRRLENNNHFAHHTCNLSWRCGIHKATFPTFVEWRNEVWTAYTEHANGSEIILTDRDYWVMDDTVLRKTKPHRM